MICDGKYDFYALHANNNEIETHAQCALTALDGNYNRSWCFFVFVHSINTYIVFIVKRCSCSCSVIYQSFTPMIDAVQLVSPLNMNHFCWNVLCEKVLFPQKLNDNLVRQHKTNDTYQCELISSFEIIKLKSLNGFMHVSHISHEVSSDWRK